MNGDNGHDGRDASGRFARGNKAAANRGNPHADMVAAWRRTLVETVTAADLAAVISVLVEKARAGERWAVVELLDRTIGKATPPAADQAGPMSVELVYRRRPVPGDDGDQAGPKSDAARRGEWTGWA